MPSFVDPLKFFLKCGIPAHATKRWQVLAGSKSEGSLQARPWRHEPQRLTPNTSLPNLLSSLLIRRPPRVRPLPSVCTSVTCAGPGEVGSWRKRSSCEGWPPFWTAAQQAEAPDRATHVAVGEWPATFCRESSATERALFHSISLCSP